MRRGHRRRVHRLGDQRGAGAERQEGEHDLFDLGYEAVGERDSRHQTFAEWKTPFREGVVYYLEGGRVRGVLLWNTWRQVDHARSLIAEPGPFRGPDLKGRLPKG